MSQITCEYPTLRLLSQAPTRNLHCHAAKLAYVKLKLGSTVDLMLVKKQRKKSNSMPVILTEKYQITCEHPSSRARSQTPMHNLHFHSAKLACVNVILVASSI